MMAGSTTTRTKPTGRIKRLKLGIKGGVEEEE
jgi:hypothetical protein